MIPFLSIITVLLGLILVTLWVVLYQLIKQQGRMLLRLDNVEGRLSAPVQQGPSGLAIGMEATNFELPDLTGKLFSLATLRGKGVLLVHWSPHCGFCDQMAPDLARLQQELTKKDVNLVLVSHGGSAANRKMAEEHFLDCPILLVSEEKGTPELFNGHGTPVAYLLDAEGKVSHPIVTGIDGVEALVQDVAGSSNRVRLPGEKSLSASKLVRNGLKPGTQAPDFALPDIVTGRTISLANYKGRTVLLVFSDPHCGPCDELAPHLSRLHRQYGENMVVVLIGRGDVEENRRKALQHAFEFPVVLQQKWELSRQYGIFATPVAFLIDGAGVIEKPVVRGPQEILALGSGAAQAIRR